MRLIRDPFFFVNYDTIQFCNFFFNYTCTSVQ